RGASATARDIRNRASGSIATVRSALDFKQPADDVLAERVRSHIGRAVRHPGSIDVAVSNGLVTLSGPVLQDELPLLLDCVFGIRGVRNVQNQLEVHGEPGNVPGLQGDTERESEKRLPFLHEDWSP